MQSVEKLKTAGVETNTPDADAELAQSAERRRIIHLSHERRVTLLALAAGLPAIVVALFLLFRHGYRAELVWTLTIIVVGLWLGCALALRRRVVRPLKTLSNLLAALREGDYSVRARNTSYSDSLDEVIREANALGKTLREQRLGALEATALLRTVMSEIDVAVFAFDNTRRLQLVNRAGERLLAQPAPVLLGRSAGELGLEECLNGSDGGAARTIHRTFDGSEADRWEVRRRTFRERGIPHQLLVLADLSRTLREEELKAWQRLVRVLGHELNNSLTPIKSIAGSLATLLGQEPPPADWRDDMERGLDVIASRAAALSRFMEAYARLARLPQPQLRPVEIGALVRHAVSLETRLAVRLQPGPEALLQADGDQLEQLLINLLRNGVDAALETGGEVEIGWRKSGAHLEVWIEDEGLGLANTSNVFVPFFTTKPGGSGIGLVLSRQIAEAHGGTLSLENRTHGHTGCIARLRLPL